MVEGVIKLGTPGGIEIKFVSTGDKIGTNEEDIYPTAYHAMVRITTYLVINNGFIDNGLTFTQLVTLKIT